MPGTATNVLQAGKQFWYARAARGWWVLLHGVLDPRRLRAGKPTLDMGELGADGTAERHLLQKQKEMPGFWRRGLPTDVGDMSWAAA